MKDIIYLDHAATTPMHPEVISTMTEAMSEIFGNPSSVHRLGRVARKKIDDVRQIIAQEINAEMSEIVFTSCGTESNNLVFDSLILHWGDEKKHIITSQIEHLSVLKKCQQLEKFGWKVTYVPVNEKGIVDCNDILQALTEDTVLVSIMATNNETGAIQPLEEIGAIVDKHATAMFHTDAVQAFARRKLDVKKMKIDFLTSSGHKLNGPKGVGFLYAKNKCQLLPVIIGGHQESGRRAGTENVVSIIGFGHAIQIFQEKQKEYATREKEWKEILIDGLKEVPHWISSPLDSSSTHILNVSFPNLCSEMLIAQLDLAGVCASGGSACRSGMVESSYVIKAMNNGQYDEEYQQNVLRLSFGLFNTTEQIKATRDLLIKIVKRLQE